MKNIPLTNGLSALVSDEDFDRASNAGKWFWVDKSGTKYVSSYLGGSVRFYLHRWLVDAAPGLVVDHINGNALDNRRENLRVVSPAENQRNRGGAQKNSISGIRGISWEKDGNKWEARIRHHCKDHYLGRFDCVEDAIAARRDAEDRLWGPIDVYRTRHMIESVEDER